MFHFGAYRSLSLVNIEIWGGIVPVRSFLSRYLREKTWNHVQGGIPANTHHNQNAEMLELALHKKEVGTHSLDSFTRAEIWAGIDPPIESDVMYLK